MVAGVGGATEFFLTLCFEPIPGTTGRLDLK